MIEQIVYMDIILKILDVIHKVYYQKSVQIGTKLIKFNIMNRVVVQIKKTVITVMVGKSMNIIH